MQNVHLVFLILVVSLVSQELLRGQDVEEADRLYQAGSWEAASQAYEAIVSHEPTNARAWFRLGVGLRRLGRYEDAVEALGRAGENGTPMPFVGYQLAATHALQGDEELAFQWMDEALEAGFSQSEQLESDEAFAGLREDARFRQAVERADINARPCELLSEYGEFDFWVGDWDVSAGGSTGKSFNYYDPGKQKWIQIWIDSGGGVIQAEGGLADGSMSFVGKHVLRNGSEEDFRMKFTPLEDGSVHQLIEQSKDAGRTWYVWFDGTYKKKN